MCSRDSTPERKSKVRTMPSTQLENDRQSSLDRNAALTSTRKADPAIISWSETMSDVTLSLKSSRTWIGVYEFLALPSILIVKTSISYAFIITHLEPDIPSAHCLVVRSAEQHGRVGIVSDAVDALPSIAALVQAGNPENPNTKAATCSWPSNLRITLPVGTSHTNTARSRPQDANVALSSALSQQFPALAPYAIL